MECDERQLNKHYSAGTAGAPACSAKLADTWPKAEATQKSGKCNSDHHSMA